MGANAKQPVIPMAREQTVRVALREALERGWATALELSGLVRLREKDVAMHLSHLSRSLRNSTTKFEVDPAACLGCGFVFKKRDRLTCPARCPVCESERISPPKFRIET